MKKDKKNVEECLNIIQTELNAPKNRVNNFQNYKYRNLDDIYEGLKPILKKLGCSVTCDDTLVMVGDRYYIKATATLNVNGDCVSVSAYARETDEKKGQDACQVSGTASSYARKYALNGLFCIDDTQDVDSMDNDNSVTDKQKELYQSLLKDPIFENQKRKMNSWWAKAETEKQADVKLETMKKRISKNTSPKELVVNPDGSMGFEFSENNTGENK